MTRYCVDLGTKDPNPSDTMRAIPTVVNEKYFDAKITAGDDDDWWISLGEGNELDSETIKELERLPHVKKVFSF